MPALLVFLTAVLILDSTFQTEFDKNDDEYTLAKIHDLFSQFLEKPDEECRRPSKQIRDTSKVDGSSKDQTKKRKASFERPLDKPKLSSLYDCDYLDSAARLCVNVRQLGTTLTIGILINGENLEKHPIHWYRVYKVRGQSEENSLSFVKFSRENLPWNINLGGNNNELRISPITETDFSYNFFLATLDEGNPGKVQGKGKSHLQLLMFRIEPISLNMGDVYHGEEIVIDIHSHMELPVQSIQYEWSSIGPDFEPRQNLPSNMKLSRDGSAMIIKEHRSYGDMIITCAVYSNKNFTLGRRNFFLKKMDENQNIPIGTEIKRRRRQLEKFYAQPFWDDGHFAKYKRDSPDFESTDAYVESETQTTADDIYPLPNPTRMVEDLSDIGSSTQTTPQFSTVNKPEEVILNFYADTPHVSMFATESEMENSKKQPDSINGLIKEVNGVVETQGNKEEQEYFTTKSAEEKPVFEDKESMLIAGCNVDADCGINAVCIHIEQMQGFCKCLPHYRGNGIFCWMF